MLFCIYSLSILYDYYIMLVYFTIFLLIAVLIYLYLNPKEGMDDKGQDFFDFGTDSYNSGAKWKMGNDKKLKKCITDNCNVHSVGEDIFNRPPCWDNCLKKNGYLEGDRVVNKY
jgi:hypothetical protein